jgi:hypothetical protein
MLPPEKIIDVRGAIQEAVDSGGVPVLVILDDDPTGTQTCHDINVLMVWDDATLGAEFRLNPIGVFILTNSRALPSEAARRLPRSRRWGLRFTGYQARIFWEEYGFSGSPSAGRMVHHHVANSAATRLYVTNWSSEDDQQKPRQAPRIQYSKLIYRIS